MNRILMLLFVAILYKAEAQSSALKLADSLFAYGEYSKAIEAYKPFENKVEITIKIAKSQIAIGDYEKGIAYYEKAILAAPKNQLYKYEFAKLLLRTKKLDEAKLVFETLVKNNNKNPNYHYHLGQINMVLGDTTFIKNFKKTYELDPKHLKAINKLGRYALSKRDYLKAMKMADKGLLLYNKSKEFTSLKAQTYYWQELYHESAEWFEKRLLLGEPTQYIHEKLSFCYERNYQHKKSIEHLEKALNFQPNNGINLFLIGKQYQYLEDFINAEKYYKLALEILDEPMDIEYGKLATVLNRQKKYKEAIENYKKAIKENPKNRMNRFFLAHTKAQYYKDTDAKIKVYQDYIEKYPKEVFTFMAKRELEKLKQEKFMKGN